MSAQVTLGVLPLFGTDGYGVEWKVLKLEGWDGADVRLDLVERPTDHGAFDPNPRYAERRIMVEGRLVAPTDELRREAIARLSSQTSELAGTTFRVDGDPFARQATVWRAGQLVVAERAGGYARWQLPLVAPDPRRYAVLDTYTATTLPDPTVGGFGAPFGAPISLQVDGAPGDLAVVNDGDLSVHPVLTIVGPITDPIIRNDTTDEQLSFTITLPTDDFLTVDTAQRTVLLNGTANRRNTVQAGSRWPRVAPGNNTFQFRASSTDLAAQLRVRFRSGWA